MAKKTRQSCSRRGCANTIRHGWVRGRLLFCSLTCQAWR